LGKNLDYHNHSMRAWLSNLRREFHQHPETAFEEYETTARVKRELRLLGIDPIPLDGLETGCAGVLECRAGKKVLGLRADLDALNITEQNDVPYKSKITGKMHACGHDANSAIMLGVAKNLVDNELTNALEGRVKFVFQPAEEGVRGARAMIRAGVLENPAMDRILSCHMWTEGKVGQAALCRGPSHASSDRFNLVIHGKGVHGASPHKGIDPILAGAHFILSAQSIVSRNVPPTQAAVVSIGKFIGGSAANIIPDRAELRGTLRAFSSQVRELSRRRLQDLVQGLEAMFGVKCEYRFEEGVPACRNHDTVVDSLYEASRTVIGEENVFFIERRTGGEDFALFTEQIPGAILRLGCINEKKDIVHPGHSPRFDLDEGALPIGVEIMTRAAMAYLRS
jgi:amidohydrolase